MELHVPSKETREWFIGVIPFLIPCRILVLYFSTQALVPLKETTSMVYKVYSISLYGG